MPAEIITGNLLNSDAKYIAHQANCLSSNAAHLAAAVFSKFPYADIYSERTIPDKPGEIKICGNGKDQRYIINLFGQYYPGRPKYPDSSKDGHKAREKYFKSCLEKISQVENLESIAFPFGIGCGAAGGNWENYKDMIDNFADQLPDVRILIIKLALR